ncbi:hypothetical protein CFAM422_003859 [Trichoderma lentiforme]|uniref:Uncharacterized protein n=1 Tax=Trichoderma lentiforme TaxID=1567552 RepID=A0A9P4XKQ0_9HYPO|nr:hypothetical protein CFAM422_003859 [Trichoderma lentiforme]
MSQALHKQFILPSLVWVRRAKSKWHGKAGGVSSVLVLGAINPRGQACDSGNQSLEPRQAARQRRANGGAGLASLGAYRYLA